MDKYNVKGMSCAACQARVEKAVSAVPGVESCTVSLLTNTMGVEGSAAPKDVTAAVKKAGYSAKLQGKAAEKDRSEASVSETVILRNRLLFSLAFLFVLMYITMGHNMLKLPIPPFLSGNFLALTLTQMLLAIAVMIINGKFFTSGFRSALRGAPNMDTLVALGSSVSFGWSLYIFYAMCGYVSHGNTDIHEMYHKMLYFESAAMIPALITVGKLLESISKGKTTNALKSLMRLRPEKATVIKDGKETVVAIDSVKPGDEFVVRPGESIPTDGVVISGESAVNESSLTGESIPVDKTEGSAVCAGTINQSGFLHCRATRTGEDTTLSQIIRMVEDAAATKAPIARIADRVSGVFVPVVIAIAVTVIAIWLFAGRDVGFALARGISVLVISCPCALGLATPVAIMVGNGKGAKNGILFKTSEALETTGKIKIIALDKTGTVTSGTPKVTDIYPADGHSEDELLSKAYSLESMSEHPLAKAVIASAEEKGAAKSDVSEFKANAGNGLQGKIEGRLLHGGSVKYISEFVRNDIAYDIADRFAGDGKTPLCFEENGELLGIIAVADTIKADSVDAIRSLKKMGLHVVMLTGDNERTANAIGKAVGVDEVYAGVLPNEKEACIRKLQKSGKVAMVGDGINDAPALTRADIGIAIGAGTDVAIDSADVVLMNSSLSDIASAIRLSRSTLKNIYENLFWAFFYNIICIPLAAGLFGLAMSPMIGAAAMSLSSFTVCMNALRLNLLKIKGTHV